MFNATATLGASVSLVLCAYRLARICAAAQVALMLLGWGMAQFPFLARPAIAIASSASSPSTLRLLLLFLAAGAVLLFPAVFLLMRIFKREALSGRYGNPP